MSHEEKMTVKEFIRKKGWNIECDSRSGRWMSVNVSFVNSAGKDDETSFDIAAYSVKELTELFRDFCKENRFPNNTVFGITITAMASTFEKLEKIS